MFVLKQKKKQKAGEDMSGPGVDPDVFFQNRRRSLTQQFSRGNQRAVTYPLRSVSARANASRADSVERAKASSAGSAIATMNSAKSIRPVRTQKNGNHSSQINIYNIYIYIDNKYIYKRT